MSTNVVESKPITFIRQIYEPLSAAVTTTATVFTVATGSEASISYIVIPKDYLKANLASGVSAILTITTGVASTETCIIPIAPSDSTVYNNGLMLQIYIDTSGNVYGEDFSVSGYVSGRGWWKKDPDGTLEQWIIYDVTSLAVTTAFGSLYRSSAQTGILWPISFAYADSAIWGVQYDTTIQTWCAGSGTNLSTTNAPEFYVVSAGSATVESGTYICYGKGRWK